MLNASNYTGKIKDLNENVAKAIFDLKFEALKQSIIDQEKRN